MTLVTGTVEGRMFRDVVLIDRTAERSRRVITARTARLEERERGVVSLVLEGVFTHASFPAEGDRYDYTTSGEMVYNIPLKSVVASLGAPTPAQQSSVDVWRQIAAKTVAEDALVAERDARAAALAFDLAGGVRALVEAAGTPGAATRRAEAVEAAGRWSAEHDRDVRDRSLRTYLLEFHWKFAVPVGCLVFAFFAWPVGLGARRSGRSGWLRGRPVRRHRLLGDARSRDGPSGSASRFPRRSRCGCPTRSSSPRASRWPPCGRGAGGEAP